MKKTKIGYLVLILCIAFVFGKSNKTFAAEFDTNRFDYIQRYIERNGQKYDGYKALVTNFVSSKGTQYKVRIISVKSGQINCQLEADDGEIRHMVRVWLFRDRLNDTLIDYSCYARSGVLGPRFFGCTAEARTDITEYTPNTRLDFNVTTLAFESDRTLATLHVKANVPGLFKAAADFWNAMLKTETGYTLGHLGLVTAYPIINEKVAVTSVKLGKSEAKMLANKTLTLKAVVSPSDATDKTVTWSSSDKTVATVDKNGKVTGKKGGKVTITATTADGKKTAKCNIQVLNKIRVGLQDGKYYLFTSKLGNFCMTVPDKSKKAGKSLVLIKQNLSGWQKFKVKKVTKDGGDYYALINKNSGLAVTWTKNDFVQKKYTGANSQLFFAMRYGDNSLQLVNKLSNRAIGIPGGKAARKANVGPVKFGAGMEQRWIAAVSVK